MLQVYILQSLKDPSQYYVGATTDLDARIRKHNEGGAPHTSRFRPWKLKTAIRFEDDARARQFEWYLKTPSGRAFSATHFR
jgi:predicted GIY-YIG superfamily endonuclease